MYLFAAPKIEGLELKEICWSNANLTTLKKEKSELYFKIKDYVKHFEEFEFKWESLFTEVIYWRKANHIHHWFVQNVQGGIDDNLALTEVKKVQIVELYQHCHSILKDKSKAINLLPTMYGPFFGSLEYDSIYFDETERTLNTLKEVLEDPFFENNYLLYQSSW